MEEEQDFSLSQPNQFSHFETTNSVFRQIFQVLFIIKISIGFQEISHHGPSFPTYCYVSLSMFLTKKPPSVYGRKTPFAVLHNITVSTLTR